MSRVLPAPVVETFPDGALSPLLRPAFRRSFAAEAMPAATMRALVREAVEAYLPVDALRITRVAEDSERDYLLAISQILEGHDEIDRRMLTRDM